MDIAKALKRVVPSPLWPYLGTVRRFVLAVPPRTNLQKKRLLSNPTLTESERVLLARVNSRIYPGDRMYNGDGTHYFKVGLSAIRCIDEVLAGRTSTEVPRILDFACGSGRVLRFLRERFPDAEITACELKRGPVQFCVRTFGVLPAFSSLNLDAVVLAESFDLIWCGSLATHLNKRGILSLLSLFQRQLRTGGLLIFTTHGDFVPGRILRRDFDYGLTAEQIKRIGASYPETGYGFEDYPGQKDYGVSLTSPGWIRSRVAEVGGLREVYFKERGWDDHQDVFGFVRD